MKKPKVPHPLAPIKNNRSGMAILLVLSFIMMITFIAKELAFESRAEYEFSNVSYRELKAYHAAKSAMELSLFRVMLYQQVKSQFGDKVPDASMLDIIWSFPMAWPPALGEDASLVAKDDMETVVEATLQDAEWFATITPEGSKIDLNDLDSPSKSLKAAIAKQIVQLIRNRLDQDDDWADENANLDPEEIVKHLVDYVDKDSESQVGGNESSYYNDNSISNNVDLPPNRMFRTMDEIQRIPGIDAVLYAHLAPQFTLYGIRAINVNHASVEVLMSIDPQITKEIAEDIRAQIQNPDEGPFKTEDDFKNYISKDIDIGSFNPDKIPLVFVEESAFNIDVTGSYKKTVRGIRATVFNIENVTKSLEATLKEEAIENQTQNSENTGDNTNTTNTNTNNADNTNNTENNTNENNKSNTNTGPEQKRPNLVTWEEY